MSLIVLVVVVAVCGVYLGARFSSPFTSVSISSTVVPLAQGDGSPLGLNIKVGVNDTTLREGQTLEISVELFNNFSTTNDVSTNHNFSSNFAFAGFPIAIWPPCMLPEPVDFMIVKGNYTLLEIDALSANSQSPGVVCWEGGSVSTVSFHPNSFVADLIGDFCTAVCNATRISSVDLRSNFTVSGYWSYPFNDSEIEDLQTPSRGCISTPASSCGTTYNYPEVGPIAQSNFTAGVYTLAVVDEWNQSTILHFSVSN